MEPIAPILARRAVILLLLLLITGVASDHGHDDDDDDDRKDDDDDRDESDDKSYDKSYETAAASAMIDPAVYVAFIVIVCLLCGFGALIGYCWYRYTGKHKDDVRKSAAKSGVKLDTNGPPAWLTCIAPEPTLMGHGFDLTSKGASIITHNTIMRTRSGRFDTDAARWSFPMTSGKHAFQITWPYPTRGLFASIGLGTGDAPLHAKKTVSLIGGNGQTWGLDLSRRRVLHDNKIQAAYPKIPGSNNMAQIPNTFFMFVDMDTGTLSFGSVEEYWGSAVTSFTTTDKALYLMVAGTVQGAVVSVTYIGSVTNDKTAADDAPPGYDAVTRSRPPAIAGVVSPVVCGNLPFHYPPPAYSVATAWAGERSWMETRPVDSSLMGPLHPVQVVTSATMWTAQNSAPPPYQATNSATPVIVTLPPADHKGDKMAKY